MKSYLWLIFVIAIALIWLMGPTKNATHSPLNTKKHPQEYMKQASIFQFTEKGRLKSLLLVEYWAYLSNTQRSQFTAPYLTVYKPDHSVWHINANKGTTLQPTLGNVEQIELFDKVVLKRPVTPENPPITIKTEHLRYQPKSHYAETEQYITMIKPNLIVSGTGMRAFLDNNAVELLHNVKMSQVNNTRTTH